MIQPSLSEAICNGMVATSQPARRPSAGAVPGRWGACLAVRTPPAACFPTQSRLLLLQLQDFFRLAAKPAEFFRFHRAKPFLVLLQPLHGLGVRLAGLLVLAQLPVGHG